MVDDVFIIGLVFTTTEIAELRPFTYVVYPVVFPEQEGKTCFSVKFTDSYSQFVSMYDIYLMQLINSNSLRYYNNRTATGISFLAVQSCHISSLQFFSIGLTQLMCATFLTKLNPTAHAITLMYCHYSN
jgi:hypothetical protein